MRRLSVLLLLLAGPAQAGLLERGPYLENAAAKMMTLRFRTDVATVSWLTYGAAPDCERFQTIAAPAREHRYPLFGLTPDTTHCYRIYLPAPGSAGVHKAFEGKFATFREEDKPYFSFLAFGESGAGSEEQLELADAMSAHEADFVLHTGGRIESGSDEYADDQYFVPYSTLLARAPFFLTLGVSEYGREARKDAGKGFLKANFTPFHSVPLTGLPPHFYFFDVAHARFFVLDTNGFFGAKFAPSLSPESKQYKWLDSYLARAARVNSSGKPEKQWIFVVMHHPMYSTGARQASLDLVTALEPLLLKHKVDMVFQGNSRNYERTKPIKDGVPDESGIVYVTLGGSGRPLGIQARNEPWSDKFLPSYHFAKVEIRENKLRMVVYGKDGAALEEFELEK